MGIYELFSFTGVGLTSSSQCMVAHTQIASLDCAAALNANRTKMTKKTIEQDIARYTIVLNLYLSEACVSNFCCSARMQGLGKALEQLA